MSLKSRYDVLSAKIDELLRSGEYCGDLINRLYILSVELNKNEVKEMYIPYNERK